MTLQNRVLPNGLIVAEPWRGELMGNRGGRIHDPSTQQLLNRRWASKRWINCVTKFKNRQRMVMGNSYTELFFLDEVSALASGHRPCFECRRSAANAFAAHWSLCFSGLDRARADAMDAVLHEERTSQPKQIPITAMTSLPEGTMISCEENYFALCPVGWVRWHADRYMLGKPDCEVATVLTPPSIRQVLQAGYQPMWHSSIRKLEHRHGNS